MIIVGDHIQKISDTGQLAANPIADIHGTTKINAVVIGGRLFVRSRLDSILADVASLSNVKRLLPRRVLEAVTLSPASNG